ncbi:hypothetical protein [Mucilaginibacter pedocola]|uniref:Uncharacterized protein n=1 Tax=Mucilaginibacter pedocola TaxID=1792845 RepID=A0A1S9PHC8_9SPHI|nr:hypothetical protein [Mucilaginibacter pedocola]OOQ60362.1 hypothetical protein BC343_25405 [Mucilaginibacter pedocola]
MRREDIASTLRELSTLLNSIADDVAELRSQPVVDRSALLQLIVLQMQTESFIRVLLKFYCKGDAHLTDIMDRGFFEIELTQMIKSAGVRMECQ